jgi:hypothetical protein
MCRERTTNELIRCHGETKTYHGLPTMTGY